MTAQASANSRANGGWRAGLCIEGGGDRLWALTNAETALSFA
jgi:hypothetical protein